MNPFTFQQAADDWQRFCAAADVWKPSGFDEEMALRLRYYLDDQVDDLRLELQKRMPETWSKIVPVTVPLVKLLTTEAAKVFLSTTKLDIVEGEEDAPSEELAAWWKGVAEEMALGLRLKKVDAYTTLLRTAGLKFGGDNGRITAHVVLPQWVRVVMDPAAPMDLDRAFGVAVELASEAGVRGAGARRWEFWCAREGEELHGILTVNEAGDDAKPVVRWEQQDQGDPIRGPDGKAIVPLVLFTAHTEELGLFSTEGKGLVPANRGLNVLLSDVQHIAEQQGFGLLVLTTTAGMNPPSKIVRSPDTAIALGEGTTAAMLNANAPIADLVALINTRLKQEAVFRGLPAGVVSIEARAVASGVALQIEMRPLLEARADAIEVYREPMRRMWDVIRAVHNAYAGSDGWLARLWARIRGETRVTQIGEDVDLRWTPGTVQMPTDEVQQVDTIVAKLKNRLCTRPEAIAELRGISLEEAKKVVEEIDAEKGSEPPAPGLDIQARMAQLRGEPPPDGGMDMKPPQEDAAAGE